MELQAKKSISLSSITFFTSILLGTMGWVVVLGLLREQERGIVQTLIDIGQEVLKVIVIAVAAGIAVERLLEREPDEDPRLALRKLGIKEIFPKRQDAGEEFLRSARDENIRRITISGISLRDFLLPGGALNQVWREICERMKREQERKLPGDQRLHVRLLLLLPNSNEGYFRHQVEGENTKDPGGIPFDVPYAVRIVQGAQQDIFASQETLYLQVRLYEHCPFSFTFATESEIFVEQYDYRDQSRVAALPIIEYQSGNNQYKEQMFSVDAIWKHSLSADFVDQVGTAAAIREARIANMFRRDHRTLLTKGQVGAIREVAQGTIDIMAISGHFYTSNAAIAKELQRVSSGGRDSKGGAIPPVPVRFALINPVSQQAILRAVADWSPPDKVGDQLRNWNWGLHQQSDLYGDARNTASTLYSWSTQKQCSIKVRLYSSSVACAILQTDRYAFIEQYMYGRSKEFQPGFNLGGEYPVLEYDVSKSDGGEMIEHQVISATFEMIWKYYSIPWESYLNRDEKSEFARNLERLLSELDCAPQAVAANA